MVSSKPFVNVSILTCYFCSILLIIIEFYPCSLCNIPFFVTELFPSYLGNGPSFFTGLFPCYGHNVSSLSAIATILRFLYNQILQLCHNLK